jgi:heptosyltransferase-2
MARAFLRFVDRSLGRLLVRTIVFYERVRAVLRGRRGRQTAPVPADDSPRNILVIKLVGLGDTVLMLTPVAKLHRHLPQSGITALVTPLSVGILSVQPYVDETIVYDIFGRDRGIHGLLRIIRLLRARKFDCVIDFEQHFQLTPIIAFLTGAPRRLGFFFGRSPRKGIFTDPVCFDPGQHMVDSYMRLLEPLGICAGRVEELERIFIPDEDARPVEAWLQERGIGRDDMLVGVHPGSGPRAPAKRWGVEKYAEIIRRLRREYHARIVITGSRGERELVEKVIEHAGRDGVYNASGDFNIRQTTALLEKCRLFISNDTGPMHMAAALGRPTIGIFGPETPVRYRPVGKRSTAVYRAIHCSPCVHIYAGVVNDCSEGHCMKRITPDDVWKAVKEYNLRGVGR